MRVRHVAFAVRLDREQRRRVVSGADVDEPVGEHRLRDHRVSPRVLHAPKFFTRLRVERHHDAAARGDELFLPTRREEQRRREREWLHDVQVSRRLPRDLPGLPVERDDRLLVRPVDIEDELVAGQNRRAAVAVNRVVLERLLRPDFASILRAQARGPHVAEVNEDVVAIDHGRRAGVAVLRLNRRRFGILLEDLHVPDHVAGLRIETHRAQRMVLPLRHRRREVDLPVRDDRRRPPESRNLLPPGHVLRLAPLGRELRGVGMPVTGRPAKLRPIGRGKCERERTATRGNRKQSGAWPVNSATGVPGDKRPRCGGRVHAVYGPGEATAGNCGFGSHCCRFVRSVLNR